LAAIYRKLLIAVRAISASADPMFMRVSCMSIPEGFLYSDLDRGVRADRVAIRA
jgi:hypothetical protein